MYPKNKQFELIDFLHDATNSEKLKIASMIFGQAQPFSLCDSKICCILRLNWKIELICCILIVMQQFLIRLISYSIYLTFKCWGFSAVVMDFLMLFMIPEIAIILSCEFFVCLFCISFGQYFQINIFKSGGIWQKHKRGLNHIGHCLQKRVVQSFCRFFMHNHVFL